MMDKTQLRHPYIFWYAQKKPKSMMNKIRTLGFQDNLEFAQNYEQFHQAIQKYQKQFSEPFSQMQLVIILGSVSVTQKIFDEKILDKKFIYSKLLLFATQQDYLHLPKEQRNKILLFNKQQINQLHREAIKLQEKILRQSQKIQSKVQPKSEINLLEKQESNQNSNIDEKQASKQNLVMPSNEMNQIKSPKTEKTAVLEYSQQVKIQQNEKEKKQQACNQNENIVQKEQQRGDEDKDEGQQQQLEENREPASTYPLETGSYDYQNNDSGYGYGYSYNIGQDTGYQYQQQYALPELQEKVEDIQNTNPNCNSQGFSYGYGYGYGQDAMYNTEDQQTEKDTQLKVQNKVDDTQNTNHNKDNSIQVQKNSSEHEVKQELEEQKNKKQQVQQQQANKQKQQYQQGQQHQLLQPQQSQYLYQYSYNYQYQYQYQPQPQQQQQQQQQIQQPLQQHQQQKEQQQQQQISDQDDQVQNKLELGLQDAKIQQQKEQQPQKDEQERRKSNDQSSYDNQKSQEIIYYSKQQSGENVEIIKQAQPVLAAIKINSQESNTNRSEEDSELDKSQTQIIMQEINQHPNKSKINIKLDQDSSKNNKDYRYNLEHGTNAAQLQLTGPLFKQNKSNILNSKELQKLQEIQLMQIDSQKEKAQIMNILEQSKNKRRVIKPKSQHQMNIFNRNINKRLKRQEKNINKQKPIFSWGKQSEFLYKRQKQNIQQLYESQTENKYKKISLMEKSKRTYQFSKIKVFWIDPNFGMNESIFKSLKIKLGAKIALQRYQTITLEVKQQLLNHRQTKHVIVCSNSTFTSVFCAREYPFINCNHYFDYCGNQQTAQKIIGIYNPVDKVEVFTDGDVFQLALMKYLQKEYNSMTGDTL